MFPPNEFKLIVQKLIIRLFIDFPCMQIIMEWTKNKNYFYNKK